MFIEQKRKTIDTFSLETEGGKEALRRVMNDPRVKIVHTKQYTKTFTSSEGDSSSSETELCMLVEWEECGL